jgi:hypothetical protein
VSAASKEERRAAIKWAAELVRRQGLRATAASKVKPEGSVMGSAPRVIMVEGVPWVSHEFHQRMLSETVPCDDAAIERLTTRIYEHDDYVSTWEEALIIARMCIGALAGETP